MQPVSRISLLLPLAFFLGAAVQFIGGRLNGDSSVFSLRELFVIASVILSLPLIYKQKWASDRNVLRGLRHLFLLIAVTGSILFLSSDRFALLQERIFKEEVLKVNWGDHLFIISWAFFSLVFILISLGTLRNLIYIKRRRTTARHFAALMVLLILYALLGTPEVERFISSGAYKIVDNITLFVLINFCVINAFRVGWINYLNKKQKTACFLSGFLLVPLQIVFAARFKSISPVAGFSPFLERFVEMGMIFLSLYLCVAFLALLAHLPTAKLYDRKLQQIRSLHDLSRTLTSEFDREKLVHTIVRLAAEVSEADFTWLELYDDGKPKLVSSMRLTAAEQKSWMAADLHEALRNEHDALLINDTEKNALSRGLRRWKSDLASLVAAPLVTSDRVLGFLYAGKKQEFGFEQDDAETMRAFADQAAAAVNNAALVEESLVKERLEQELSIAHDAQMKLLPKSMPELPGVLFDAVCVTANEVGGDYYDFFNVGPNRTAVVIGDVSGKGPSAAFYMAEVKGVMEALARLPHTPESLLTAVNETIYRNFDRSTFISLIYGVIDAGDRSFTFCRAGHCPILYYSAAQSRVESLEPRGLGVGLTDGALFQKTLQTVRIDLLPGDAFLLYTDGVTEARSPEGEEFGEERLTAAFAQVSDKSPQEMKKHILHCIYSFFDGAAAHDDLTFVVFKVGRRNDAV